MKKADPRQRDGLLHIQPVAYIVAKHCCTAAWQAVPVPLTQVCAALSSVAQLVLTHAVSLPAQPAASAQQLSAAMSE